jgi:hypothetical protein
MSAITELEKLVKACKNSYYNGKNGDYYEVDKFKEKFPAAYLALVNAAKTIWIKKINKVIFNDTLFDSLEDTLRQLNPKSKALMIGAPVKKEKVNLPFHMGSLDKIKPGSVSKWLRK